MDLNVFCSIALALSIATLVFAIIIGIKTYRSEFIGKGDALYKKHFVLTPFQIFLICFFLGTVYIFIPIYYTDYFAQEMQFARVFKSIFLSIHNTMRLFILDGDFDIIENAVTDPSRVHYAIGNAYSVYASFLFVVAPVMTASFVLSFFKNVSSYVKYTFSISTKIFYISELNEKSIALATNILAESGIRKPLIVFFDVIFAVLPNKKLSFISQFPGAVLCALAWNGISLLLSIYINYFNGFSMYGSLTTVVLMMLWLYFCIYSTLMCAEFNVTFGENLKKWVKRHRKI